MGGTMALSTINPPTDRLNLQESKKQAQEGTTERMPKLTRILGELGGRDGHASDVCMRIIRGGRLQKCPNENGMQEVPSNLWLKQTSRGEKVRR